MECVEHFVKVLTMRIHVPTSKARIPKLAPLDVFWAAATPFIALALRNPDLLEVGDLTEGISGPYQFVLVTFICAIPAFLLFRISDGMNHLFSVHDAFAVCAAVATTVASSSLSLFLITRLDGVPRSTPLIYGLVLGAGLILDRAIARVYHQRLNTHIEKYYAAAAPQGLRRIVLIGADRFSALTIKLLEHQRPRTTQAVAALELSAAPSRTGDRWGKDCWTSRRFCSHRRRICRSRHRN